MKIPSEDLQVDRMTDFAGAGAQFSRFHPSIKQLLALAQALKPKFPRSLVNLPLPATCPRWPPPIAPRRCFPRSRPGRPSFPVRR